MPRRKGFTGRAAGAASHAKLEKRLVLLAWLNLRFGYETNQDLLADIKQAAEGFDANGRSYVGVRLESRAGVQVPRADMVRYDDNIRAHLRAMNAGRSNPITLRYFQHLAALYTEIYLDWFFHRPGTLQKSLNHLVLVRSTASRHVPRDAQFTLEDLRKLAFWMATGSGKTLLMHLNYRQFLHYNKQPLDNVLLITPNEGLSDQHLAEMNASGIPCGRFNLNASNLVGAVENAVSVMEITKLVERKQGGGVSVPVEAFEGNNLIFVDEGHKGSGGDVWRGYRQALGETGFTFEYSATFGQALTAARTDELTAEYGKAIAFDYSYRYFHGDGFGKDFNILNLQEECEQEDRDLLLLGSMLAFYEQKRVFAEQAERLHPYNLDNPLWVFVGGTVNAVYSRNKRKRSDVLEVAAFLHRVLRNRGGWAVAAIGRLLQGESGLKRPDGADLFDDRLGQLRGLSAQAIYQDLLARVLHTHSSDVLQLGVIRNGGGEIGLKASSSNDYFGVIYIGDLSRFRVLVAEQEPEIAVLEEAVVGSLFNSISRPDTTIEVLIGARKFMEGWNSWRVSSMGLLNVGRNEGAQIIQLFGRGVRLRGKGMSLQRSAVLPGPHPKHVGLLETLNIFAIRADYMAQFRSYLEREDVHVEGSVELPLAIRPNKAFLRKGLVTPRVPGDLAFVEEGRVLLVPQAGISVQVDMALKVQSLEGADGEMADMSAQAGHGRTIPAQSLNLVDWQQAYMDLIDHREQREFTNLAIEPQTMRAIFEMRDPACYELIADDRLVLPSSSMDAARLTDAVVIILKKYVDKFYQVQQERWASNHMRYMQVRDSDENFQDYKLNVPLGDAKLLADIKQLIREAKRIYEQVTHELPNVHFDRHLYQPLLVEQHSKVKASPPALNEGEHRFVEDLRHFCRQEKNGLLAGKEIFLLRNQGRGKGVGFFNQRGFFPDFILWVKTSAKQRIVFIEPHGMLHAHAYQHDDKARLHESLHELAEQMAVPNAEAKILLDSYIVSATAYQELRPRYDNGGWDRARFAEAHILFPERNDDYDYLARIMHTDASGG